MTRFEALKAITSVKEFSNHIYDFAMRAGSPEKLAEFLADELTEEGLRLLKTVVQKGNYPISFMEANENIRAGYALNCMAEHIKSFCYQARNGETADFGKPCTQCSKRGDCDYDWISRMDPLLRQSSVKISMDCLAQQDTPDSDGMDLAPDKGTHTVKGRNKHPFCNQQRNHFPEFQDK